MTNENERPVQESVVRFHEMNLSSAIAKEADKYLKSQIGLTEAEKWMILLFGVKRLHDDLWAHHERMAAESKAEAGEAQ